MFQYEDRSKLIEDMLKYAETKLISNTKIQKSSQKKEIPADRGKSMGFPHIIPNE